MIRLQRVAVLLLGLPVRSRSRDSRPTSEGPGAKNLGRPQSGNRGVPADRRVRAHRLQARLEPRKARCTFRARRPCRANGLETAAAGSLPGFLRELQSRNRRLRGRQAPEDGHGAPHAWNGSSRVITGAAQLWVENIVDCKERDAPARPIVPSGKTSWYGCGCSTISLATGTETWETCSAMPTWNLILIDHSRAFGTAARSLIN